MYTVYNYSNYSLVIQTVLKMNHFQHIHGNKQQISLSRMVTHISFVTGNYDK